MPVYEFRCKTCGARFEEQRPMAESSAPAVCPAGHADAVRLLSVFATAGAPERGAPVPGPTAGPCGPACGCHA